MMLYVLTINKPIFFSVGRWYNCGPCGIRYDQDHSHPLVNVKKSQRASNISYWFVLIWQFNLVQISTGMVKSKFIFLSSCLQIIVVVIRIIQLARQHSILNYKWWVTNTIGQFIITSTTTYSIMASSATVGLSFYEPSPVEELELQLRRTLHLYHIFIFTTQNA